MLGLDIKAGASARRFSFGGEPLRVRGGKIVFFSEMRLGKSWMLGEYTGGGCYMIIFATVAMLEGYEHDLCRSL